MHLILTQVIADLIQITVVRKDVHDNMADIASARSMLSIYSRRSERNILIFTRSGNVMQF